MYSVAGAGSSQAGGMFTMLLFFGTHVEVIDVTTLECKG